MLDSIEPCSKFRLEQTALKRLGEESRIRKNPDQICNRCKSSGFLILGRFCVDVNFLLWYGWRCEVWNHENLRNSAWSGRKMPPLSFRSRRGRAEMSSMSQILRLLQMPWRIGKSRFQAGRCKWPCAGSLRKLHESADQKSVWTRLLSLLPSSVQPGMQTSSWYLFWIAACWHWI